MSVLLWQHTHTHHKNMIPDSHSAHLSQSFQVKPKVAFERRAPTLSEESLPTLTAQQSSGTTESAAAAVCFSTKVSLNDPPFIRRARRTTLSTKVQTQQPWKKSRRFPPGVTRESSLRRNKQTKKPKTIDMNQRKRASDTNDAGGIRDAVEQQAL